MTNYTRYLRYLTFKPFNVDTAEGRKHERYRLALWAAITNALSTALAMLALLITIPITLPYLGDERFGIWMTIASIASLLSFLDFGIGNGLINRVVIANTSPSKEELCFVVTTGFGLLLILAGLIWLVFFPLMQILPWEKIIKTKDPAHASEIQSTLQVFLFIFAASIPLNAIQKIYQGMQAAWAAHLVRALGAILSLLTVCFLASREAGIPALLIATFGLQTIFPIFLLFPLIRKKIIRLSAFKNKNFIKESLGLMKSGGLFFLLQVGGMIVWSIDSIIISATLGASNVTMFAIVQRLFQFILVPLAIINSPLWGAYADAHARGDKSFIAKTFKKSMVGTMLIAFISILILSSMSPLIFDVWLKNAVEVPLILTWSYGGLIFLMATGNSLAMFLNGIGEIKSQILTVFLFCIIAAPLKYLGVVKFGIEGLIWASIIAYISAVLLPYVTFFRARLTKQLV